MKNEQVKHTLCLIVSDTFLNSTNGLIELWTLPHERKISKDEGLLHIKSESNDILSILNCLMLSLFHSEIFPQELFIISHLDHKWNIKYILIIHIYFHLFIF